MPYIGNNHAAGDHVNNFKVLDDISSYTATFDGSASAVVSTSTNTIRVPEHRFIQGQRVTYNNGGGGNIAGLVSGTAYFVSFDTANTIRLATSLANANNNTVINLTNVGSGASHTLIAAFDGINKKFKLTHGGGISTRLNHPTQINVAINNVVQKPNLNNASFTEGFSIVDNHKIIFKTAPISTDIFWGSVIANTITTFDVSDHKIDTFTGDGTTTDFNLSHDPANNESIIVTINGVLQHPSNTTTSRAYTLLDNILQFTSAPANGDEIQVRHMGFAGATTADVSGFYGRTGNVVLTSNDHITTGNINAGIVTATSFVGSFSPNAGGTNANFTGIVTAANFKGGDFEGRNLKITGLSTFVGDAEFSGNVSIAGTLTYEDVTNIDSVGLVTAREGIAIPDSRILSLGDRKVGSTLGDLRIYHNGSDSYIDEVGAGNLYIRNGSKNSIWCQTDGPVHLYHNNNTKLSTSNTGVTIDGTAVAGALDISGDIDVDGHTNLDNVSIAGITTTTENIRIQGDNKYLTIGAGNDIGLVHTGGESFITNATGHLTHRCDVHKWENFAGSAEYLRIDSDGRILMGSSASRDVGFAHKLQLEDTGSVPHSISIISNRNTIHASHIDFAKTRGTSLGSNTIVQDGDYLGHINFRGADGTDLASGSSRITGAVDGTPGSNQIPGRLMFWTADSTGTIYERLRITSGGKIQVTGTRAGALQPEDDDTLKLYTKSSDNSINRGSGITFYNHDNSGYEMGGTIQVAKENGTADNTAGYMRFSTRPAGSAAQERLRITSDGKFGFNDSSPERTIDVKGANCMLQLEGTGGSGRQYSLCSTDNTTGASVGSAGQFVIYDDTSGTSRLNITSDGKVGIKETTPEATFEVDGRIRVLDNNDAAPSTGKGLEISYFNTDDMADILSYDRSAGAYKKLQLRGSSVEIKKNNSVLINAGVGGNGITVGFSTTNALVTNAEIIATRGYSSFKSPNSSYAAIYVASEGNTNDTANQLLMWNAGGANRGGIGYVPNTGELRLNNQYFLTFCTGGSILTGTERLRITSSGEVRIGGAGADGGYQLNVVDESNRTTTAETALLLYAKHDGTGTTGPGFGTGIRFWGDRASGNVEQNMGRIMCTAEVNSGTTLSGALSFDTSVAGVLYERLRITSGGDVCIGNFTPVDTRNTGGLHIQANKGISFRAYGSVSGSRNWRIRNDDSAWGNLDFTVGDNNSTDIGSGAADTVLSLASNHCVGINNTAPDQRLKISGNIELNAYDSASGSGGYYTSKGLIIGNAYDAGKTGLTDDRNSIIWSERGLDLDFATSDTLRMKIDYNGNVGIGEDAPNRAKLHVRGADGTSSIISKFRNPSSNANSITKIALVTGYGDHNQDTEGHAYICAQRGSTGNTTSLYFETSTGTTVHERMRISKDGYVTKPQTPAFFATHTGAGNSIIGTLTYNTSGNGYYNNGGHLNVGTGKFTAPVNGIYTFHFHGFFQTNQNNASFEVTMRRTNSNGTGAISLTRQYGYRDQVTNQYGPSISMHCTTYLTSGQTVEVRTSGLSFHGSNGYYFGGHLVG